MDNKKISSGQAAFLKKELNTKRKIKIIQICIFFGFFIIWEFLAKTEIIDPFIFSMPSRMVTSLVDMVKSGILFKHIGITVFETFLGFSLGTILGVGIAIALWWNSFLLKVLEPYLVIFNSLPKTALAPIIIVWLGNNMTSIVATALMTSVIVTVLSVLSGFLAIDEEKIKLLKTFGATKKQILYKVILPASLPSIINALKINVGLSFVGVIVGEFLVSSAGLGYLIVYGSQIFKLDWVMLSVIILAFLAAVLYQGINVLEKAILKKRG